MAAIVCTAMLTTGALSLTTADASPSYKASAVNYSSARASISFSHGMSICRGKICGFPEKTTRISIHLYLQRFANGSWNTVADWNFSGNTVNRTLKGKHSASKGHQYRAKAVFRAYDGAICEKVKIYSRSVYYWYLNEIDETKSKCHRCWDRIAPTVDDSHPWIPFS